MTTINLIYIVVQDNANDYVTEASLSVFGYTQRENV